MRASRRLALQKGSDGDNLDYLYNDGDQCTAITGGWGTMQGSGAITNLDEEIAGVKCLHIKVEDKPSLVYAGVFTFNAVNLSQYDRFQLFTPTGVESSENRIMIQFFTGEPTNPTIVKRYALLGNSTPGWYTGPFTNNMTGSAKLMILNYDSANNTWNTGIAVGRIYLRKFTPPSDSLLLFWDEAKDGYAWSSGVHDEYIRIGSTSYYKIDAHGHVTQHDTASAANSTLTVNLTGYNKVHFHVSERGGKGDPKVHAGSVNAGASVGDVTLDISGISDKTNIELRISTGAVDAYDYWDGRMNTTTKASNSVTVTRVWATTT